MRTVHHLLSDREWEFDDDTSPEHALAFVYCTENNLASWYFNHNPHFEVAHQSLNFEYGEHVVGLDDYATMKETRTRGT